MYIIKKFPKPGQNFKEKIEIEKSCSDHTLKKISEKNYTTGK